METSENVITTNYSYSSPPIARSTQTFLSTRKFNKNINNSHLGPISISSINNKTKSNDIEFDNSIDKLKYNKISPTSSNKQVTTSPSNLLKDNKVDKIIDEKQAKKNDLILQERIMEAKAMPKKSQSGSVIHKFSLWNGLKSDKKNDINITNNNISNDTSNDLNTSIDDVNYSSQSISNTNTNSNSNPSSNEKANHTRTTKLRGPKVARELQGQYDNGVTIDELIKPNNNQSKYLSKTTSKLISSNTQKDLRLSSSLKLKKSTERKGLTSSLRNKIGQASKASEIDVYDVVKPVKQRSNSHTGSTISSSLELLNLNVIVSNDSNELLTDNYVDDFSSDDDHFEDNQNDDQSIQEDDELRQRFAKIHPIKEVLPTIPSNLVSNYNSNVDIKHSPSLLQSINNNGLAVTTESIFKDYQFDNNLSNNPPNISKSKSVNKAYINNYQLDHNIPPPHRARSQSAEPNVSIITTTANNSNSYTTSYGYKSIKRTINQTKKENVVKSNQLIINSREVSPLDITTSRNANSSSKTDIDFDSNSPTLSVISHLSTDDRYEELYYKGHYKTNDMNEDDLIPTEATHVLAAAAGVERVLSTKNLNSLYKPIDHLPEDKLIDQQLGLNEPSNTYIEIDEDDSSFAKLTYSGYDGLYHIKWKRGKPIGEGTFGRVYKGLNEQTGEFSAVKQLNIGNGSDKEIQNIKNEIEVMWQLDHENIVRYQGTSKSDKFLFIVLEYISGGSIASLLLQYGSFSESLIRKFSCHIIHGVEYLHQKGIIHRDIKGANVLVTDTGIAKIADFGCSKQLAGLCTTSLEESLRAIRGSVPWMAPEVIKQSGHGRSSDIWSVGATIIEMATGKPPWSEFTNNLAALFHVATSKDPPPIPDILSKSCANFLTKCMMIDCTKRPTAQELMQSDEFILLEIEQQKQTKLSNSNRNTKR